MIADATSAIEAGMRRFRCDHSCHTKRVENRRPHRDRTDQWPWLSSHWVADFSTMTVARMGELPFDADRNA